MTWNINALSGLRSYTEILSWCCETNKFCELCETFLQIVKTCNLRFINQDIFGDTYIILLCIDK